MALLYIGRYRVRSFLDLRKMNFVNSTIRTTFITRDVVIGSVASVSLSVCPVVALTFKRFDLQTSFLVSGTSSEYLSKGRVSTSNISR